MWAIAGTYAPTVPEVLIVVGVIVLGALAFILLCSKLLGDNAGSKAASEEATQTV